MASYEFFKNNVDVTNQPDLWNDYDRLMITTLVNAINTKDPLKNLKGKFTFVIIVHEIFPMYITTPEERREVIDFSVFTTTGLYIHEVINRVNDEFAASIKKRKKKS